MNYVFKTPSTLRRMASVKIAAELWNRDDIRNCYAMNEDDEWYDLFEDFWENIMEKVLAKVSVISLPEPLKDVIREVVHPIGMEVFKWWYYHNFKSDDFVVGFARQLSWTHRGSVDCQKTARAMVKDETLDVEKRYELACAYCFEEQIRALWRRIPEGRKIEMSSSNAMMIYIARIENLVDYWTWTLLGEDGFKLNSSWLLRDRSTDDYTIDQIAFQWATYSGSVVASEFFLKKLSPRELDKVLVDCALEVLRHYRFNEDFLNGITNTHTDVLCFLLNRMSEEQLERVFKDQCSGVLECLLEWPWQCFFVETAKRWWRFITSHHYHQLLQLISTKMWSVKDFDYSRLFRELWRLGSVDFKREYFKGRRFDFLYFFEFKEEELLRVVLKEAPADTLERSVYYGYIDGERWDQLKLLLNEDVLTEETVNNMKTNSLKHYLNEKSEDEFKVNCDKFFQLADEFFVRRKKRVGFDENSVAKKQRI